MASYLQNMFLLGMHKENRTKMLHLTVSCEPEDLSHCFTVLVVDRFFFFQCSKKLLSACMLPFGCLVNLFGRYSFLFGSFNIAIASHQWKNVSIFHNFICRNSCFEKSYFSCVVTFL